MTNQQYIEEIIKVAIEGEYPAPKGTTYYNKDNTLGGWWYKWKSENEEGEEIELENPCCFDHIRYQYPLFLDPNFFRAIGKVKWDDENKWRMIGGVAHKIDMETGKYIPVWIYHALRFYEINLTKNLDHAIEWLYKLIKE